jgi:hypothetical protein
VQAYVVRSKAEAVTVMLPRVHVVVKLARTLMGVEKVFIQLPSTVDIAISLGDM